MGRSHLRLMRDELDAVDIQRPDMVPAKTPGRHRVAEPCVLVALPDGTELATLLPVRRLLADGEKKSRPRLIE